MVNKTVSQNNGGRSRSIYESISRSLRAGAIATPSYLRLESAALGTQSTVDFNLLKNDGAANETENRLNLTDNFLATAIGFYIIKVTTAGVNRGNTLRTFPNSIQFSGANEAANLMNLYNGKLGVTINGEVILDSWDLMRHYRVGSAQKGILTAATGTGNAYDQSTWDSGDYGMYPLTPQIKLRGNGKNIIRITCPASVDMVGTGSTNYAVIIFKGLLLQNDSKTA